MKKVTVFQMAMVLFLCMSLAVPSGLMAQEAKEEAAEEEGPALQAGRDRSADGAHCALSGFTPGTGPRGIDVPP